MPRRMLVKEEIRLFVEEGRGGAGKLLSSSPSLKAVVREQGHGRHRSR
jgi:hypothetical protein